MDTKTVTSADGTTIAFEQTGSGPAVILVASALADRSDTRRWAALLAPHLTVINYDRHGRGASGDVSPYPVEREVEDIAALIDAVGGSAFLFGSSSGAALALTAASYGLGVDKARHVRATVRGLQRRSSTTARPRPPRRPADRRRPVVAKRSSTS